MDGDNMVSYDPTYKYVPKKPKSSKIRQYPEYRTFNGRKFYLWGHSTTKTGIEKQRQTYKNQYVEKNRSKYHTRIVYDKYFKQYLLFIW